MPIFGFTNIPGSVITQTSIAVASGGASDADAQAFITAASITDPTQISAIDQLVIDLKGYNIWTKMKAIYPICGGSASSHAVNLISPGTYDLTFSTGWTHASTGMTPASAYANTNLATTGNVTQNSASMGFYNRTNTATVGAHGLRNSLSSPTALFEIFERYTDNNFYCYLNDSGVFSGVNSDSRGFFQGSRTASNAIRLNRNTSTFTGTSVSNGTSTLNVYIGASNFNNTATYYQNREISFFYIGSGLTNSEMQNYYTRVQAFNTALNRQV